MIEILRIVVNATILHWIRRPIPIVDWNRPRCPILVDRPFSMRYPILFKVELEEVSNRCNLQCY